MSGKIAQAKAIRRRLTVLQHTFGFEKPYKVLCDGTFLQAALEVKMYLKEELPKVLQAPCNPMVTNCIRDELRRIGDDVSGASLIAKRFTCVRCSCEAKSARACIAEHIGDKNTDHYVVATQDMKLRRQLRSVPGVPLLFITHGKVALEQLSETTTRQARDNEIRKNRPTEKEEKAISKRKRGPAGDDDEAAHPAGEGLTREGGEEDDHPVKKKRKGPKGVNPLAMKKPQKVEVKGSGKKKKRQHRKRGKGGQGGGLEGGGE